MRTSLRWAVAAGVIVAAGASTVAATGGFGAASPPRADSVAAGDTVDVGAAELAVNGWTVRDDVATRALEGVEGAVAWLVVAADVTATTERTTKLQTDMLALPGDLGLDDPEQVTLLPDILRNPDLQPGLPSQVLMLWPLSDGDLSGDELTVDYVRLILADSTIDASQTWRPDELVATATVARDDAVGDQMAEED